VAQQKDGFAVKSEMSWRNKRWYRGEFRKIVAQQKDGIAVNSERSWRNKKMA
jgi:hypothetical protein